MPGIRPEFGRNLAGTRPEIGRNSAGNWPEIGRKLAGIWPEFGQNLAGNRVLRNLWKLKRNRWKAGLKSNFRRFNPNGSQITGFVSRKG